MTRQGLGIIGILALVACNGDRDYDEDGWYEPKDCDDGNPLVHPDAEEVAYDGVDQDCDGSDLVDRDGDGYQAIEAGGPDCNDFDPNSFPGAVEIPYDGVDQNCDDWNDNDFDLDGFEAMGHGGEDCDDTNPVIIPLDLDGDGYSPCTGDCDESDARRNEEADPICGNGFDDDCDNVSDCTTVGILTIESLAIGLAGGEGSSWLGGQLAAPGDLDGDGRNDLLFTSQHSEGQWSLWAMTADLRERRDESDAWARIDAPYEVELQILGDIDGDNFPEMTASASRIGAASPTLWLFSSPPPGTSDLTSLRQLEISGDPGDEVGASVALVGDHLAVGAPGIARVALFPSDAAGVRAFEDDSARITGDGLRGAGAGLLAYDPEGDGVLDLIIAEQGDPFGFGSGIYLVSDPPTSGSHSLDGLAEARIDTRNWGPSSFQMTSGDLDGDGRDDGVIGAPFADSSVGAVLILLDKPASASNIDEQPVQRLGLGDDTFGWSVLARDFDGDGQDDLIVGAPASWGSVGGAYKPGAVHLWYGPVDPIVDHTFTADLLIQGSYTSGFRTFHGYALALEDVDGDGGQDLLDAAPLLGTGQIHFLPGGLTGLYGL